MKILISGNINYYSFNGQTIFMKNLAEGFARRGHEVMLLVPSDAGYPRRLVQNGVQIEMIESIGLPFWHPDAIASIFPGKQVSQIIKEFHPDIIHIHDHYPLCVAVHRVANKNHIKVVGTNHFMPENLAPHVKLFSHNKAAFEWIMWKWMLGLFNRLDAVTAPSRTAVNIIRKNGLRAPVCPISNGVNTNVFHQIANLDRHKWRSRYGFDLHRLLFLYIGRIDGEKRIDILLYALARLQRKDIQLGIVGKGTDTDRLKSITSALNLNHQVYFTGFVPDEDLPSVLNAADVFAMPSEAELQSIATLEAMSCGKPVLAANSQALPELVANGINGYLFEAGNPASAAEFIAKMADNQQLLDFMGKASLSKVETHSIENTLFGYEKLYEKALAGSPIPQFTAPQKVSLKKVKSQP